MTSRGQARTAYHAVEALVWHRGRVPATEPFPRLDLDVRPDDAAERIVRRLVHACESPEKRLCTNRRLRRWARSALRGSTHYSLVNWLASSPLSRLTGFPSRAKKMQLISAHLLGIAYIRYVFRIEPVASMPDRGHHRTLGPGAGALPGGLQAGEPPGRSRPVPVGGVQLPRRCELCAPASR